MNILTKRLTSLGAASIIAVAGGYLVGPWEGKENKAYKDIVGIPSICFGETLGVKMGDYRTDEQCEQSLAKELSAYNKAMKKHVKVPLQPYEEVAYTSFVWNLGETNFKNSTMLKKLNAGDHEGACKAILDWNKATFSYAGAQSQIKAGERCTLVDGKYSCTVKGLTNRRYGESEVCLGKNKAVNDALKALESVKTGPGTSKNISQGVGVGEASLSVSKPSGTTK